MRAAELRLRILVATGLYPTPPKTPLNAVIHGKFERPGFTVEKVYFESYPGRYVTGLLFRPSNPPPDVARRTRPYFRMFFALCKKHGVTIWNEHEPMEHMSNYFKPAFGIKPGEPW